MVAISVFATRYEPLLTFFKPITPVNGARISVKLEFSIPEKYKAQIRLHEDVRFNTETSTGTFSGKVYAFEPKVDKDTRTITIRAICSNPDHSLIPGSFAKVDVPLKELDKAMMVPSQAIIPEMKGQKVFISRDGKAMPVKIMIGLRNDSAVQVTSGLEDGDTVLTTGIMQVRAGMPVKVNIVQ